MKSMTGYAYRENVTDGLTVSVEIKSYNSRFLDLSVNQPFWLSRLENRVREYASSRIQRGKVELTVRIKERTANLQVTPDPEAARAYMGAVMEIADALGHSENIPLSLIIAQEGVLRSERVLDMETYWASLEPVLAAAFADFDASRETEGTALAVDINRMIARIEQDAATVSGWVPEMERIFRDNIRARRKSGPRTQGGFHLSGNKPRGEYHRVEESDPRSRTGRNRRERRARKYPRTDAEYRIIARSTK
jgi:uncharacterized protein (TIGR00255 family)